LSDLKKISFFSGLGPEKGGGGGKEKRKEKGILVRFQGDNKIGGPISEKSEKKKGKKKPAQK